MKIDSAYVGMESARRYTSETKTGTYVLSAGIGMANAQGRDAGSYSFSQLLGNAGDEEMQSQVKELFSPGRINGRQKTTGTAEERKLDSFESFRQACILYLIRWLYEGLSYRKNCKSSISYEETSFLQAQSYSNESLQSSGFGMLQEMGSMYSRSEAEDTAFRTEGMVRTADGRQISFQLELGMSRRFSEYTGIHSLQELTGMTDPLVINLDTPAASISDQKFEFDIDADGHMDSISMPVGGSGFLALDENGDGIINDGSELFGTKSGDGFSDLARFDSDGNGWIDENDDVFEKLLVWCKDENGADRLYTLKESGVGAICLMKADTDFTLQSAKDFQTKGRIRETGIFLYENGGVGTIQHLDLAR